MTNPSDRPTSTLWARFRFSVVGSLLSSPPRRGELRAALQALAAKTWTHPVAAREVRFSAVTIERWYYTARREQDDPVGVRFELPCRFRHFRHVWVRYAQWDLSRADLVDRRDGILLAPIYPLDRQANADGQRLLFERELPAATGQAPDGQQPAAGQCDQELPPLLKRLLAEYSATGLPPAYLPKGPRPNSNLGEAS